MANDSERREELSSLNLNELLALLPDKVREAFITMGVNLNHYTELYIVAGADEAAVYLKNLGRVVNILKTVPDSVITIETDSYLYDFYLKIGDTLIVYLYDLVEMTPTSREVLIASLADWLETQQQEIANFTKLSSSEKIETIVAPEQLIEWLTTIVKKLEGSSRMDLEAVVTGTEKAILEKDNTVQLINETLTWLQSKQELFRAYIDLIQFDDLRRQLERVLFNQLSQKTLVLRESNNPTAVVEFQINPSAGIGAVRLTLVPAGLSLSLDRVGEAQGKPTEIVDIGSPLRTETSYTIVEMKTDAD